MIPSEKSEQIERSFGIRHANKALNGALRKPADLSEVTPYQRTVARRRLCYLEGRGLVPADAAVVMLMGGARLEGIAAAIFTPPNKPGALKTARDRLSKQVRQHLTRMTDTQRERLIEVSHEVIRLWVHV